LAVSAAAERVEEASSPAALPPRRLMSPLGYVVVAAVMVITAGMVYFMTRNFQDVATAPPLRETYEDFDLGPFTRDLAPDVSGVVRDTFMVKVVLLLNPGLRDLPAVRAQLERRKNLLRDVVQTQVLSRKTDAELRQPGILDALQGELRRRLNAELGPAGDGQDVIHRVIFPDSRLPGPR
jgi:flagellar basal body-associated protein FliL